MNNNTLKLLIPIISGLAGLIFDMARNWTNKSYVPVAPEELERAIERLQNLPDLPEEFVE